MGHTVAVSRPRRKRLVGELKRSNDELSQFAHIVSPDLQAPIRMVKNFTQLLSRRYRGKIDPDADTMICAIENGATSM